MDPRLAVEAESIRTTNSESIFGKVYLAEEPTVYFPELGWTDFVGDVLDHCLKVVSELRVGDDGRVSFLDGPFILQFTSIDADSLRITGKRRTKSGEADLVTVEARKDAFLKGLLATTEAVLRVSDERGWQNLHIVMALRARLEEVKRNIAEPLPKRRVRTPGR